MLNKEQVYSSVTFGFEKFDTENNVYYFPFQKKLTFEQMKAYNEIMGNTIGPAEVNVIKKLDKKYLEIMNG